ncbi:MAG: DUF1328 domain-containing protein [Pseudomonadota bacterium]
MLPWAAIFFCIAALSGIFAFGNIAAATASAALVVCGLFSAFFLVTLAIMLLRRLRAD